MDIFRDDTKIKADENGIYFITPKNTLYLTGPPLDVWQIKDDANRSKWKNLIQVSINLGRACIILKAGRKVLKGKSDFLVRSYLGTDSIHQQICVLRHLTRLRDEIVGKELFTAISRIGDPSLHLFMCWLAMRVDGYAKLVFGQPFIAGLLAYKLSEYNKDDLIAHAQQWSCLKDHEIVQLLGFPSKSCRILQHATSSALTLEVRNGLRETLNDNLILETACHLHGPVFRQTLEIMADSNMIKMVTPKLLNEIHLAESEIFFDWQYFTNMLKDAIRVAPLSETNNNLPIFDNIDELRRYVKKLRGRKY